MLQKGSKSISDNELKYIDGFDHENDDFPSAICNGCHFILQKSMSGKEITLPEIYSYDTERPLLLHSIEECDCKICEVAKAGTNSAIMKKKNSGRRPKMEETPAQAREIIVICSKCFSRIGRGYTIMTAIAKLKKYPMSKSC